MERGCLLRMAFFSVSLLRQACRSFGAPRERGVHRRSIGLSIHGDNHGRFTETGLWPTYEIIFSIGMLGDFVRGVGLFLTRFLLWAVNGAGGSVCAHDSFLKVPQARLRSNRFALLATAPLTTSRHEIWLEPTRQRRAHRPFEKTLCLDEQEVDVVEGFVADVLPSNEPT